VPLHHPGTATQLRTIGKIWNGTKMALARLAIRILLSHVWSAIVHRSASSWHSYSAEDGLEWDENGVSKVRNKNTSHVWSAIMHSSASSWKSNSACGQLGSG
jgi:hypothetical protein